MKKRVFVGFFLALACCFGVASCHKDPSSSSIPTSVTPPSSDTSVVGTYNVSFDANTGTGSMDTQAFDVGEEKALTTNTFTKEDCIFVGWALVSTATSPTYSDGQTVKDLGGADTTVTLYAVWQEAGKVTIIYDANGGTGSMDSQDILVGELARLTTNIFTKEGADFLGWATSASATTTDYVDTEFYAAGETADIVTLYAVWGVDPLLQYANFVIEDGEDKGNSDLQSEWTVKKYGDGDNWVDCDATLVSYPGINDSQAIKWNYWDNYTSFRYSKDFSISDKYNVLSFDIRGNGITGLKIRLASPVYEEKALSALYDVGTLPNGWTHYELNINDDAWKVKVEGLTDDLPIADALAQYDAIKANPTFAPLLEGLPEINSRMDIMGLMDKIHFTVQGITSNGNSATAFIDNIKLERIPDATTSSNALIIYDTGIHYTAKLPDGTVIAIEFNEARTSSVVRTINLETNVSFEMAAVIDDKNITLTKDEMVITATYAGNGEKLAIISAPEEFAQYLQGVTFGKIYYVEDFESYTETGSGYDATDPSFDDVYGLRAAYYAEWYQGDGNGDTFLGDKNWYTFGAADNYIALSDDAHSGDHSMQLLSRQAGNARYITRNLIDGEAAPLGNGYYVSFWAKNPSDREIKFRNIKACYTDTVTKINMDYAIWGTGVGTLPANSDWTKFMFEIDPTKTIYGFSFIVEANGYGPEYILIDDITIHSGDIFAEYVPPIPMGPEIADLSFNFQECSVGGDFNDENWIRAHSTNGGASYTEITGQMRVRERNGSIVINLYGKKGSIYRYSYDNGSPIGKANHFSIDLANYWSGGALLEYRVSVTDHLGNEHFILGTEDDWCEIEWDSGAALATFGADFEWAYVMRLNIYVKGSINSDQYLYMDNVVLSYIEPAE